MAGFDDNEQGGLTADERAILGEEGLLEESEGAGDGVTVSTRGELDRLRSGLGDTLSDAGEKISEAAGSVGEAIVGREDHGEFSFLPKAPVKLYLALHARGDWEQKIPESAAVNLRLMWRKFRNDLSRRLNVGSLGGRLNPWSSYREARKCMPQLRTDLAALRQSDAVSRRAQEIAAEFAAGNGVREGVKISDVMKQIDHPLRYDVEAGRKITSRAKTTVQKFTEQIAEKMAREEVLVRTAILEDTVEALKHPKKWAEFTRRMAGSFEDYMKGIGEFETQRAAEFARRRQNAVIPNEIEEFSRVGENLDDLLNQKDMLIETERREILRLSKEVRQNPALKASHEKRILKHLQRIATAEGEAVQACNKFVAENAEKLRARMEHSRYDKYSHSPGFDKPLHQPDILESYRMSRPMKPFRKRTHLLLNLGARGNMLMLLGVGAGSLVAHIAEHGFSAKAVTHSPEMLASVGKGVAGFIPVVGTGIDLYDTIRAVGRGDWKDALINAGFFVGSLASDITTIFGFGVAGRAAIGSAKAARLAAKAGVAVTKTGDVISAAKDAKNVERVTKAMMHGEKVMLEVVEEGGQTGFRLIEREAMEQLEKRGIKAKIFSQCEEFATRQRAALANIAKFGFATGVAMMLSGPAMNLAEWTFGNSTAQDALDTIHGA